MLWHVVVIHTQVSGCNAYDGNPHTGELVLWHVMVIHTQVSGCNAYDGNPHTGELVQCML